MSYDLRAFMTGQTIVSDPTRTTDLDAMRAEITTLRAHRAALAAILDAVPVAEHNAAVLASGVNLLTYTAAMEATSALRAAAPRGAPEAQDV